MVVRLSSSVAVALILGGAVSAITACSSDSSDPANGGSTTTTSSTTTTTSSGGSGSETPVSATECRVRCEDKLQECRASEAEAKQGCTQVCAGGLSEGQLTCLAAADCEEDLEPLKAGGSIDEVCPKGSPSSSTTTSTASSSGNASNDTPTELTVTATIPSDYKAIHVGSPGEEIGTSFSVAPKPTFTPAVSINAGHLPLLDKASSVTLASPERPSGACGNSAFKFSLNSSQIGVAIAGTDKAGSAPTCATFTDDIVQSGAKFTLRDVPWSNSSAKATVTIILKSGR